MDKFETFPLKECFLTLNEVTSFTPYCCLWRRKIWYSRKENYFERFIYPAYDQRWLNYSLWCILLVMRLLLQCFELNCLSATNLFCFIWLPVCQWLLDIQYRWYLFQNYIKKIFKQICYQYLLKKPAQILL